MKIKLLLILCLAIPMISAQKRKTSCKQVTCQSNAKMTKENPFASCKPCKWRKKSSCAWDNGPQHWPNPIYDGSIQSARAATLSDVGYPLQPRNFGIM